MTEPAKTGAKPLGGLDIGLWVVQILLFVTFVGAGLWKAFTPIPELAAKIPWAGQVPPSFVYTIALIDILGGAGVVLPSATRIAPWLTWVAALGCAALMVCAIVFHFSRGEAANTPFNFVMVGLALFVAWGRRSKAPIQPRG